MLVGVAEIIVRACYGQVIALDRTDELHPAFRSYCSVGYKKDLARRLRAPELFKYTYPQQIALLHEGAGGIISLDEPLDARPKLLFLGDSVTYGSYVKDKRKIFTAVLQKKMPGYQVLNMACPGFNIFQVHALFWYSVKRCRPGIVVYVYHGEDQLPMIHIDKRYAGDKMHRGYISAYAPFLYHVLFGGRVVSGMTNPLFRYSSAYKFFLLRLGPLFYSGHAGRNKEYFDRCFRVLLRDMAEYCRRQNMIFIVVQDINGSLSPSLVRQGHKNLPGLVGERGPDVLKGVLIPGAYYLPDNAHFTPAGHRRMAEELYPIIQKARRCR